MLVLKSIMLGLAALSLAPAALAAVKPVPPELPAETLSVISAVSAPERFYVADVAISHINDGRIRVFDARGGRLLGMISSGFTGNFALSAKGDEMYLATSYLARGVRGERTDVLEVHDTSTLGFKYEVVLPPHRAQALSYRGLVRTSADGRFVLIQNATPATSVTIVDLAQRKPVTEISTPGCWGIHPSSSHPARFSMLCGDGKVATLTLDGTGQLAERQASEPLFDADTDAWFHHAENRGDRYWFVSFQGKVTEMDLGGPVAKVARPAWSLVGDKAGWRPGGYQPFAVDPQAQTLVVGMHDKGGEGSHKRPAKQLWVFDLAAGKRVSTLPGHGAIAMNYSHSGERLQTLDGETAEVNIWAAKGATLKPRLTIKRAGEAPTQLESQD